MHIQKYTYMWTYTHTHIYIYTYAYILYTCMCSLTLPVWSWSSKSRSQGGVWPNGLPHFSQSILMPQGSQICAPFCIMPRFILPHKPISSWWMLWWSASLSDLDRFTTNIDANPCFLCQLKYRLWPTNTTSVHSKTPKIENKPRPLRLRSRKQIWQKCDLQDQEQNPIPSAFLKCPLSKVQM